MGAATKFHRHAWYIDNPHDFGVLLAKHRNRTSRLGLINGHLLNVQIMSCSNPAIDQKLNLFKL
ncbi:MAG: Uncharacterised protein [Prochlorococcus marinus str. MIT 9215]|nr:MAG: Uncharacterised protein [Prochlorococcus marinus str. MIT 9215]